jgi:hypothetical protein
MFKKMLGLVIVVICFCLLALPAWAWLQPVDANGKPATSLDFVGGEAYTIIGSTSAALAHSGPCLVYGYSIDGTSASDYIEFRDSATANTSSTKKVARQYSTTAGAYRTFPVPIVFDNGVSFNLSSDGFNATLYYRAR